METDKTCYICFENDGACGCDMHPICKSCSNQWRKACMKKPHRFLYCPYCQVILSHPKDDRDRIVYCDECDRDILVHKKYVFTDKKARNKILYEKSDKFRDNNLKNIRFLY